MIVKMILNNPMLDDPRVYKEAKYYISRGHQVEVLCWDRENEAPEEDIIDGIKLHRFHYIAEPGSGFKKQIGAYLKFRSACINYLKGKDFDILHCHDLDGAIVGLGVHKNVKKVFDMHEYYLTRGKLLNMGLRYFIQRAQTQFNYIIYLNDFQKADVKEKNKSKLLYLPNYPEKTLFNDIDKTKSKTIRIGYAGNIRTYKAFTNLFGIVDKYQNIQIDLYGEGTTLNKLKVFENDKIQFHGRYNYEDSNKIYKNIDIVNCVYDDLKNDGFPIKFFESMVTKTPIIGDKNSVISEIISKYDIGFLVDVNDLGSYVKLFDELENNPGIVLEKKKHFDNVKENISWEDVVKVLNKVAE